MHVNMGKVGTPDPFPYTHSKIVDLIDSYLLNKKIVFEQDYWMES